MFLSEAPTAISGVRMRVRDVTDVAQRRDAVTKQCSVDQSDRFVGYFRPKTFVSVSYVVVWTAYTQK